MGPQHIQKNKRRRWLFIGLTLFVLLALGGSIYAYYRIDRSLSKMTATEEDVAQNATTDPSQLGKAERLEPFTVLIMGVDTRQEIGFANTDVMMLAAFKPEEKSVQLLSIPRDTRVMIPDYGFAKINAAYAIGDNRKNRAEKKNEPVTMTGPKLAKKTVEGLFGVPVDHYVLLDFEAFKKIIDALGGIDIDVERRLVYHDPTDGTAIDLKPGLQHLNGEQALGYVRHRHDDRGTKYYSSDFDRNRRQQIVLKEIADKVKSYQGITHFFELLDIAGDHIKSDFTKNEIKTLASAYLGVGSEAITVIEANPYWDSIGYTLFPKEDLDRIRKTLWQSLHIPEEQGLALINPKNDEPLKKKTTSSGLAQPGKSSSGSSSGNNQQSVKTSPGPEPKSTQPSAPSTQPEQKSAQPDTTTSPTDDHEGTAPQTPPADDASDLFPAESAGKDEPSQQEGTGSGAAKPPSSANPANPGGSAPPSSPTNPLKGNSTGDGAAVPDPLNQLP